MDVLGIIPARAGSERLPHKHLHVLGPRRLIEWSFLHQVGAGLRSLLVSTNDEDVIECAKMAGVMYDRRPEKLCAANTPSIEVLRYYESEIRQYDAVMLLQPTSPFRTDEDINSSIDMMASTSADAVVSVTDAKLSYVFEIGHGGRMRPVENRRGFYTPNGAIYLLTREALERHQDWWTAGLGYAYQMPPRRSVDIDTMEDLMLARSILEQEGS